MLRDVQPPLRVAVIDFLNTAPLIWGLEQEPRLALSYTMPSACAEALRDGTADIGIVPVIEMARIPGLAALPGIAIGASERVRSIYLISRCPAAAIRSLCLDSSSRTSAALVQILLRHKFVVHELATQAAAPDWRAMLETSDAALLIGDPALRFDIRGDAQRQGLYAYDLASEWYQWTGLPFVFALWAVRRVALQEGRGRGEEDSGTPSTSRSAAPIPGPSSHFLTARFQQARDEGLGHLDTIARQWSTRLGIPASEARLYLETAVEYDLGAAKVAGLRHFFRLAAIDGLIAASDMPEFLGQP